MWRARRVPGVISVGSRARGALGEIPGRGSRFGHSGHVATRATSGETLPAVVLGTRGDSDDIRRNSPGWVLRTRVALAGFRGKYHSLDFTAHSGASGRVAAHSEASGEACGALGGLRGWLSASALGDRCRAPKAIPRGFEGAFGWFPGHVAFLRKVPKEVPSEASKGAFGRASGRLRRGFRDTRHAPKGSERGCFGVARPEGVFEGGCEGVFRKACSEGVFEGGSEWVLRAGFRRGFRKGFREGLRR